jgi:outer membrane receptor for ferrienterochelin and colicins
MLATALFSWAARAQEDSTSEAPPEVSETPTAADPGLTTDPNPAPDASAATPAPPAAPESPVPQAQVAPLSLDKKLVGPTASDNPVESVDDLANLSLESLLDIPISVASKSELKASQAPSIVTVIPRSTILTMGYRSVADALRSVPGLFVSDDLVTQNVAVRGVHGGPESWSRVIKVMINGHPVTYHSTGGTLLGHELIPIEAVERIEVIRGTGSALYGANAFLGVINLVTRRPKEAGSHLEVDLELGLVGGQLANSEHVHGSVAIGETGASYLMFSLRRDYTDRSGLTIPESSPIKTMAGVESENDVSEPKSAIVVGNFDLDELGTIGAQYSQQVLDAYGEFSSISTLSHENQIGLKNEVIGIDHRISFLDEALAFHTYGTYSTGSELQGTLLDANDPAFKFRRERPYTNTLVGSEASFRVHGHELMAGFQYQELWDRGDRTYFVASDPESDDFGDQTVRTEGKPLTVEDYAPYAQLTLAPWRDLRFVGTVRYDKNDVWEDALNYRLALTGSIAGGFSGKLVSGTSYMPPAPVQLQLTPLGADGGVLGNADLSAQRATTHEIEVSYKHQNLLEVALNLFYTDIQDRVEFVYSGSLLTARNVASTRSLGGEIQGRVNFHPVFSSLSVSYQHTTPTDPPDLIPSWWRVLYGDGSSDSDDASLYYPSITAFLEAGVRVPEYFFEAALTTAYVGSRKSSAQNLVLNREAYRLPAYVRLDLTIRAVELELLPESATTLSLHMENILDTQYATPGYRGVDIPNLGRALYMRLSQTF